MSWPWALRSIGGACAALLIAAGVLLGSSSPAQAVDVFVEVNPSTIQAGFQVGIRGSCGDNLNQATVHSDAFGTVTLTPQYGFLTAAVTIPEDTQARAYRIKLSCPNGASATATLNVIGMERPTRGPNTGGGGTAGGLGAAPTTGGLLLAGGLLAIGLGGGLGLLTVRHRRVARRG